MLTSFSVKNFRGLRETTIAPLGRINLITGKNNTGKTALLEAIYLHCKPDNPQATIQVNEHRGIHLPTMPADPIEETFGWLFPGRLTSCDLELISTDQEQTRRTLSIHIVDPRKLPLEFLDAESLTRQVFSIRPDVAASASFLIVLKYTDSSGNAATSVGFPIPSSSSFASLGAPNAWHPPIRFISFGQTVMDEENDLFSELEASHRQNEILEPLQHLLLELRRLSLLMFAGKPVIHGDVGQSRLVPMPFMGEGLRRLLAILLGIANTRGGLVLIDAIDAGMHHSVLKPVFTALERAARASDVQVFATTHSYECIKAAHEVVVADGTYDLRLHRLDRVGAEIKAVTYDRDSLGAALDLFWEVR